MLVKLLRISTSVRMSESFTSTARQYRSSNGAPWKSNESSTGAGLPLSSMDDLESELWLACAGPLISLPPLNSIVMYWPQGHIEQVVAWISKSGAGEEVPHSKQLPPYILCRLSVISLRADPDTDEVYAQFSLLPLPENDVAMELKEAPPPSAQTNAHMFCKTLTASDTSTHGGFSVPRRAAEECLPPLDYTMNPPCQELVAKDLHGAEWKFRHIYRGHPRRHLLTTGWSVFVSTKRLVAGDSVVFLRGENGQLRLGVRRANKKQPNTRTVGVSNYAMHLGILAAASHAALDMYLFTVIYYPRTSPSEFIIPYYKYAKAQNNPLTVGSRFKMKFESEDSPERRYAGTITGISASDPERWPNSAWRSVQVGWDETAASERHERVSPWEIEPFVAVASLTPPSVGPRPKRRPPTLVTDSSPLGTSQSVLDPFQSSKLARILQGHDPRNSGMSPGDDDEGDAVSSRTPWNVKRESVLHRTGAESWLLPRRGDNAPVADILCGLPGGAQRQEYGGCLALDPLKRVEMEKQHLRLCVQNHLRDQHKDVAPYEMLATSLQLSPRPSSVSSFATPQAASDADLQFSANSATIREPPSSMLASMQWPAQAPPTPLLSGSAISVSEPPSSAAPSWLTTHRPSLLSDGTTSLSLPAGEGLVPSTSPNNEPSRGFPAQTLSFGTWDKPEQDQSDKSAAPVEQQCKLFGFDLTDKVAPVVPPASIHSEDSEESGPCPAAGLTSPGCGNQQLAKASNGGSQGWVPAPVRSLTKVYQQGKIGRSIEVKKFESYGELKRMLAQLFSLEGLLDDPTEGWQVVYTDHENDVLLVGDDPWEEFCSCVRSLKILSPAEAAGQNVGKHAASSSSDDEDEWGQTRNKGG